MKRVSTITFIIFLMIIGFTSCNQTPETTEPETNDTIAQQGIENEVAFEEYILGIDGNDSLASGNSLFYSKGEGEFTEVEFFVNSKNEMVKMIEYYTQETMTVAKNIFYLKEGKKFASRELFEQGYGDDMSFAERITYYSEEEKPIYSKMRVAAYEQDLDFESFNTTEKTDCSYDRAIDILNQQGEFNTTFQGFIKEDPFLYIIVGGSDEEDYTSSLVVQKVDHTILKLQANELDMIGTPLTINFEAVEDPGQGFKYQILMSASIR